MIAVLLTAMRDIAMAALTHHVLRVIAATPKKQMVEVHAGRIIAAMAYFHAFGDATTLVRPKYSVR